MNKSDLIEILAEKTDLTQKISGEVVELVFKEMTATLKKGEKIEIRGFGSFTVKNYKPYTGRNPKSGEAIEVKKKRLPCFTVGKQLKERVDS